jgi:hypothetical protein
MIVSAVALRINAPAQDEPVQKAEQFHPTDVRFQAKGVESPFLVDVAAEFAGPDGQRIKMPGFYNGENTWIVRFAPPAPGDWTYRLASSSPLLNGKAGKLQAVANTSPNIHGRLRVDPQHPYHMIFEDGKPCFVLGFECDWLWALDAYDPSLPNVKKFADLLAARGFNQVILNIYAHDTGWAKGRSSEWDFGPPPTKPWLVYPWEGTNDAPDFARMNLPFWAHYDRVIECLMERGILAHVMLRVYNKMVRWPPNGTPEDDLYYRYAVARYAAYPNVIWDFAKEAHNEKDTPYKLSVIAKIRQWDPYRNLVTVHDDNANYDNGTYNLLDFRSDQQHGKWGETILAQRKQRAWPVHNVEYGYERGVEDLPTYGVKQDWDEVLRRTWEICCAGGYCTYYYSNTSWDLIKWEPEPPGWKCYRILRDFFESARWWAVDPHPELVAAGRAWCLAAPGSEYILFAPQGGRVTVRLEPGKTYLATVMNPRTGEKTHLADLPGGDRPIDLPPEMSVLLIVPK